MGAPHTNTTDRTDAGAALVRVRRYECLELDIEEVHRFLGLVPGRGNHARWFDAVKELAPKLARLPRPRVVYRIDPVRGLERRRLELESNAEFAGSMGQFLTHSVYVATFVATIGSALERLARRWMARGRIMNGMIADALASEAAEAVARRCQDEIRDWARPRGLDVTPRYSPGYCGMDVRQQVPLFAGLPTHTVNVHLTPSRLMVPVKSVSGLIGIGPADKVGPTAYPCERCDHPDCMQRRTPFKPNRGTCFDWADAPDCPGIPEPD